MTDAGAKFDFGFADTNNFGIAPLTRLQTVQLVYAAELTGVSAYLGGAGVLTPGSANLTYAAAILGTEARHTTAVAIILNGPTFNETPKLATAPLAGDAGILTSKGTDIPLTPDQVLNTGGTVAAGYDRRGRRQDQPRLRPARASAARASCSSKPTPRHRTNAVCFSRSRPRFLLPNPAPWVQEGSNSL